ncbi:uncharacterized protein HD556DRAFT_1436053 [Suillus plorans]|uniref:Uncharacterized protein n=1 Tax=Suillus plorans TaxID=116603 RepID=A0A9P7E424_9AGAM|nr:uncharacterized protein HD556DRAFT_1436053 [Suillus plorans]KAG1810324.1 hypothetical protein HD556DRAFT_1436053 [Suillus plorans]
MPPSRHRGLFCTIRITRVSTRTQALQRHTISQPQATQEGAAAQARYHLDVSGLGLDTMDALNDMHNEDNVLTHEDGDFGNMDIEPLPDNMNNEESIVCAIRDYIDHLWTFQKYKDTYTWCQHLDSLHANRASILPTLVIAFLQWKATASSAVYEPPPGPECSTMDSANLLFTISVVDIFTLRFLGNTPHNPSMAVSLRTLEHYRLIRLRKPSFIIEAF